MPRLKSGRPPIYDRAETGTPGGESESVLSNEEGRQRGFPRDPSLFVTVSSDSPLWRTAADESTMPSGESSPSHRTSAAAMLDSSSANAARPHSVVDHRPVRAVILSKAAADPFTCRDLDPIIPAVRGRNWSSLGFE
jgi:hypothetical protein